MITKILTETAEVATETNIVEKIYSWGSWVKPAMLIMGGLLVIGIVAQVTVAIVKGK